MLRVTTFPSEELEDVRVVIRDLARVRRDDVVPRDHERETHESEEHGGEQDSLELERNGGRELEALEARFEGLGGVNGVGDREVGKGEVMDTLERRLRALEERIRFGR